MEPTDPISILADNRLNSDDFFQILESHRRSCQREGRFDEAELTRMRILELRAHEEHAKREQMVTRQQAERANLEEAHRIEVDKLTELWEQEAIPSFEEAIKVAVIELREKHRQELEEARWKQEKELEKERQHPPIGILNLKKKLETIAQSGNYQEAKKVKLKLMEAEEDWNLKLMKKLKSKWIEQSEKLSEKQEKELESLHLSLGKQRKLRKSQWDRELDIVMKRYMNVKRDLDNQHKIEMNKLKKEFSVKRRAMETVTAKEKRKK